MSNLKEKIKAAQIDLIKELGIDKLNQEEKEKIITDIGEVIQKRIVIRVIEELPEEKQDEFQGLLDKAQESPELLDEFLKENIPGLEDMILEEIGDYKEGAVDFMKQTLNQDNQADQNSQDNQTNTVSDEIVEGEEVVSDESREDEEVLKEKSSFGSSSEETLSDIEESPLSAEINKEEPVSVDDREDRAEGMVSSDQSEEIQTEAEEENQVTEETEPEIIEEIKENKSAEENEESLNHSVQGKPVNHSVQGEPVNHSLQANQEEEKPVVNELEQEQIQDEAKILEENRVENETIKKEELDLTNELSEAQENLEEDESKKE